MDLEKLIVEFSEKMKSEINAQIEKHPFTLASFSVSSQRYKDIINWQASPMCD